LLQQNYIQPNWPAPNNVKAFTSCRGKGFSLPPYDSFNLAQHVGDEPSLVNKNRQLLPNYQNFVWLNQIHSNTCIDFDINENIADTVFQADACFSSKKNQVCAVMTADCLPILLCDKQGSCVAAVHAGWRGLADGILENTVSKMPVDTKSLMAWMGPAISQKHFEVGKEIKKVFALGITQVFGGDYCTYQQNELFFSHRRATYQNLSESYFAPKTGRMVSAIYFD
jgi:copper oxidase (laccase) domain-containing protein